MSRATRCEPATPLAPTMIAPAPRDAQRDLASSRVPLTQTVDVVAPPVSAPQRDVSSTPKLSLPAPAVVAPPPSQVSRDLNSWGSSAAATCAPSPCLLRRARRAEVHAQDPAAAPSRRRLCLLQPASTLPFRRSRKNGRAASGSRSGHPQALTRRFRRRRAASARTRRRQSPLRQRTRQQGHWRRRSARPGFRRSSADERRRQRRGLRSRKSPANPERK
jgi:hypothetical protein